MMHLTSLPKSTLEILNSFAQTAILDDFYLSGGTALALYLDHRESEDLDFFSECDFDPLIYQIKLSELGRLEQVEMSKGTLNGYLKTVKIQLLHYPYPLLQPLKHYQSLRISSFADIACTKLMTVSMRGSKKDFVDIYYILQRFSLDELFALVKQKYRNIEYNELHLLKSLVFFDDADRQPMPRLRERVEWNEMKNEIIKKVKAFKL